MTDSVFLSFGDLYFSVWAHNRPSRCPSFSWNSLRFSTIYLVSCCLYIFHVSATWSDGLTDQASAPGAGDSGFASWADHCLNVAYQYTCMFDL